MVDQFLSAFLNKLEKLFSLKQKKNGKPKLKYVARSNIKSESFRGQAGSWFSTFSALWPEIGGVGSLAHASIGATSFFIRRRGNWSSLASGSDGVYVVSG